MPLPPITRFSSLSTNSSPTNNNNGLYAPQLTNTQIANIPAATKVNGGMWYNEDAGQFEIVTQNKVQPVAVGASGVFGPGASVTDNIVTFGDNTGSLISDSGILKDNVVIAAGAATANKLLTFTGVGKNVQESGFVTDDIVTNTGAGIKNNIVIFDDGGGKVIADSGVSINKVPNPAPLLRFADSLTAPNVTVNEIGNLGHIRFINDVSSIYVDTLTSVRFFPYNTQICSVFTSEIGSLGLSTSESALLEVHSDSGALLLSRLTTAERTALNMVSGIDGTNGMLLFNTDTLTFNGYDGTKWRDLPLLNTDGTLTVADPVVKTNAATKAYVDAAVSGIPSATITLTGNVTGSGVVTSPIATTLNMTLDQIKAPVASLDLNSKNIINLLDPTTAQQAATKNYVDTRTITLTGAVTGAGALGTSIATTLANINTSQITNFNAAVTAFRLDQFAVPTTSINLNSQKIINVLNPTLAQDAATKNYVDTSISGAGIAPATAKYIIQTANATLTNAQVLGSLQTGLLKNATTTGVLTIGVAGTDYYSPGNPTTIIDNVINFFIGTAARNLTLLTGLSNTGIGTDSLLSLTTGTDCTSTGNGNLKGNTTGTSNSSFGARGLAVNVLGNYNSAFGAESLRNNNSNSNSAFGYQTLFENTTGSNNSAFGYQALFENIAGSNNSAFGYQALPNNTVSNNSAFGYQALFDNTTGSNNSAFGYQTLSSSTTGTFNNSFGSLSLTANTTGGGNNAFGYQTLSSNTTGVSNSAFGSLSLTANITGSFNSAFGDLSGVSRAIYTNCTFFGFAADASVNNLTNAIAIGYQASVGASNSMVLGGSGANQLSVGIGITPNAQFQLPTIHANRKIVLFETANNDHQVYGFGTASAVGIGTFRFQIDATTSNYIWNAGVNSTTSNELMRLTGTGFLGIGTVTPNAPLQFGSGLVNRKIVLFETANNDHEFYGFGVNAGVLRFQLGVASANYVFYSAVNSTTSNELMRLSGIGNLSIGTTNQNARIDIIGGVQNVASEESCIRASNSSVSINAIKIEMLAGVLWELRSEIGGNFSIYNRTTPAPNGGPKITVDALGTTIIRKQSSVTYYGTAATITAVVVGTFTKLNWPGAIASTLVNYSYATNRVTYAFLPATTVQNINQTINFAITAGHNGATAGEITTFALYKNNTLIATVRDTITAVVAPGGIVFTVKTVYLTTEATVTAGDYFEIFVTNTVNRNITVTDFNFTISST